MISKNRIWSFVTRLLLLLMTAVTMAVSCPGPDPPDTKFPPPTESFEKKAFMANTNEGLYVKGACIVRYAEETFQKSFNEKRRTYRIQSDDQITYVHIVFIGELPAVVDQEVICNITYTKEKGEETILIVKLVVAQIKGRTVWLWNELQKTGIILDE
ncbi:MAG TPA: hypothetical protein PL115_08250 [Bacteroidales bacterium]|jgi:hypothetical protein|nr:hypothetical protein [Bacteroidales bacterium]HPY22557.1 hypothetical protein [Bacteroidales bacterium]HQA93273.1 hypothetical protein [Bacteroidales bacterium]HQN24734.1 hypothetical protein [Bacteroidales bacterium]HQP79831.1 hypothetical protein [Bacteroidales bacterium]